jgi:hypothetical protein
MKLLDIEPAASDRRWAIRRRLFRSPPLSLRAAKALPRRRVVGQFSLRLKKIPQSCDFENVLCGQNRNNRFPLRCGMYLIQVMLIDRLPHELANAIVQSVLGYQIRASAIIDADALIAD